MEDLRDQLLDVVARRGYERRAEPFTLSSGGQSHDYVDLRRAVASGPDLELGGRVVAAALDEAGIDYDAIGGMTMGADPFAHAVALVTGKSWFSIRKASKEHGTGRRAEGAPLGPGIRAVVFEDTVSTGRSLFEALEVVVEAGASVVALCTVLDRGPALARRAAEVVPSVPIVRLFSHVDLGIEAI